MNFESTISKTYLDKWAEALASLLLSADLYRKHPSNDSFLRIRDSVHFVLGMESELRDRGIEAPENILSARASKLLRGVRSLVVGAQQSEEAETSDDEAGPFERAMSRFMAIVTEEQVTAE